MLNRLFPTGAASRADRRRAPAKPEAERVMLEKMRLPNPFVLSHRVTAEEIDAYNHVNNAVYLQWLDRVAWSHSAALGLPVESCVALRRGMAVRHTRVDYLQAALLGDELLLGTWIVASDERLRCTRRFDVLRADRGVRLLEAEIDYVCLNLDTGKPCRFPPEFSRSYGAVREVADHYDALPAPQRRLGCAS
jgi:acyl-CoA thioester hydrolase